MANPLVSTLFPHNRTHYLNILHASWPAGLVLGGLVGWILGDGMHVGWKLQLSLFLVPTVLYGIAFFGQRFPKSEASAKGLSVGQMLQEVGILGALVACLLIGLFFRDQLGAILGFFTGNPFFSSTAWSVLAWATAGVLLLIVAVKTQFSIGSLLLFVLFMTHALVGAVELGTDGWIQNITGNILTPAQGKILFVFTSLFMFSLRFCAHFIEKNLKLSPIGLLVICAVLGAIGLRLVSGIETFAGAMIALAVYALGKTFFWPTMLAVVGDRFPRTRSDCDVDHGRHRHDVGRADWRSGSRLRQGPVHRRAPHRDRAGGLRAVQGAGAEQVPLPRRNHRTRRHEAVGGADGGAENAGSAAGGGRQHRRRP